MNEILSIHDLSVNYGGIEAVKGISFDVHEGEIVTLIGANGAGKSSTLRTIAGLVKPSGGTINFRGDNTWLWYPSPCPFQHLSSPYFRKHPCRPYPLTKCSPC